LDLIESARIIAMKGWYHPELRPQSITPGNQPINKLFPHGCNCRLFVRALKDDHSCKSAQVFYFRPDFSAFPQAFVGCIVFKTSVESDCSAYSGYRQEWNCQNREL
jgi:hypothetical protein